MKELLKKNTSYYERIIEELLEHRCSKVHVRLGPLLAEMGTLRAYLDLFMVWVYQFLVCFQPKPR